MKTHRFPSILFLIVFCLLFKMPPAQAQQREFVLPVARLGEDYRVEVEAVLRDNYRLKLESGTANAVIVWRTNAGEVPAGLSVRTDGTITGNLTGARPGLYQFSLIAVDMAAKDEPLELRFSVEVRAGRLRLTKIEGPRLVPVDSGATGNSASNHASTVSPPPADPTEISTKRDAALPAVTTTTNVAGEPVPEPSPTVRKMLKAEKEDLNNPFSSMNKRFILGVEQTGGASTKSAGKPFLNLFINTPLVFDDGDDDNTENKLPRVSVWGDVRLTSTPAQVKAFANISSAAVDTVLGGKANELAMGFDFVVGPELRFARFNNHTMSFISAFGAVSPLNPKDSVELFEVPKDNSSQAEAFFKEFPGAKGKQHIAFIAPERDRFLRQYYAGLRFRTYTKESGEIQNVFPSMLDVTFGQSEAVTGGKLHKFVFGLDGFYVLPFPTDYRFLYLFGSAKFKVGGPKTIKTPFLLDTSASSVKVTDANVFIADPIQSNRDVYRIGFGVDLFELFRKP